MLGRLGKSAKVSFATDGEFPKGAGPTPAEPWCSTGGKCAAMTYAQWAAASVVWAQLDFGSEERTYFQYAYESDGKNATATAIGDLDCDGTAITYKLEMSSATGEPDVKLIEPTTAD